MIPSLLQRIRALFTSTPWVRVNLEDLEDAHDIALAKKRIAEFEASGEELIPAEEVFRRLNWKDDE